MIRSQSLQYRKKLRLISGLLVAIPKLGMKPKHFISKISEILLTRQRVLCRSKRRRNSWCAVDNRLTCQRALCNQGKRQGDSQRVIDTRFTCQRALCNRGKRQGDSQRVIATDLVHGSSTTVENRVQLREKLLRTYEKRLALMRNYEN